jgi:hypothetical protein
MRAWMFVVVLAVCGPVVAGAQQPSPAPADSVKPRRLVDELQRRDREFFPADIHAFDLGFRDSLVARLDSLGVDAVKRETKRSWWRHLPSLEVDAGLWDYNRVEGLVAALGVSMRPVFAEGGYATASEEWRYRGVLRPRFVFAEYADQVVPFGSNRPFANSLLALTAAQDEQDYLRRRGGAAGLWFAPGSYSFEVAYEAGRENSMPTATGFAFLGHLGESNPPIDEGIDRAIAARATLWSLSRQRFEVELAHRVAGGGLGGDFTYNRTAVRVEARRYLPGGTEVYARSTFARTGGTPPVQRLGDIGGMNSVRGFDRRTLVGDDAFVLQTELLLPYALPLVRLQFVPWVDTGSVEGDWRSSAGIGVQRFIGIMGRASNLRVDVEFPLGPDRPDDVRFELRFAPGLI